MSVQRTPDSVLLGGPRDGTLFTAGDAAVVQLEIDGLVQRYLRTSRWRDQHGQRLRVFVYDGAGSPYGGSPGLPPR